MVDFEHLLFAEKCASTGSYVPFIEFIERFTNVLIFTEYNTACYIQMTYLNVLLFKSLVQTAFIFSGKI